MHESTSDDWLITSTTQVKVFYRSSDSTPVCNLMKIQRVVKAMSVENKHIRSKV
jgi:hypothetical protein